MELIDRKALANEDPCEHCHYKKERCVYTCGENGYAEHAIWRTIDDAPTIDAVPVVRCKDCKWSHHDLDTEDNLVFMCEMWDEYPMANEDGYCHKGRRKEVIT